MKKSKAVEILEFVQAALPRGRRYSEIQKFICERNGRNYNKRTWTWSKEYVKTNRGYYCTNLQHLLKHCFKIDGYYFMLNDVPKKPYANRVQAGRRCSS